MSKSVVAICCLVLAVSVLYPGQVNAADEDTQASVYLVFDPETGEFVTVDDPSVTAQHAAQQEVEAIESGTQSADSAAATSTSAATESRPPILLAIGGAAVVLIIAGALWRRRSQQSAA